MVVIIVIVVVLTPLVACKSEPLLDVSLERLVTLDLPLPASWYLKFRGPFSPYDSEAEEAWWCRWAPTNPDRLSELIVAAYRFRTAYQAEKEFRQSVRFNE